MKRKISGSEAFVEAFRLEGVEYICGIVGSAFMDPLDLFLKLESDLFKSDMSKVQPLWQRAMLGQLESLEFALVKMDQGLQI